MPRCTVAPQPAGRRTRRPRPERSAMRHRSGRQPAYSRRPRPRYRSHQRPPCLGRRMRTRSSSRWQSEPFSTSTWTPSAESRYAIDSLRQTPQPSVTASSPADEHDQRHGQTHQTQRHGRGDPPPGSVVRPTRASAHASGPRRRSSRARDRRGRPSGAAEGQHRPCRASGSLPGRGAQSRVELRHQCSGRRGSSPRIAGHPPPQEIGHPGRSRRPDLAEVRGRLCRDRVRQCHRV